jgi:hypothetical protein
MVAERVWVGCWMQCRVEMRLLQQHYDVLVCLSASRAARCSAIQQVSVSSSASRMHVQTIAKRVKKSLASK